MQSSGWTDDDLLGILKHVHLAYLPDREGGLDTRKEWKDILSGGEKQRVSLSCKPDTEPTKRIFVRWALPGFSTTSPNSVFWTNARVLSRPM
jgi:hypothetical protein